VVRRLLALALLAALTVAGCGGSGDGAGADIDGASTAPTTAMPGAPSGSGERLAAPEGLTAVTLVVTMPDGRTVEWCVWLADEQAERAKGLMFVEDPELGGKAGVVFLYDDDNRGPFWMRNTRLPLSIAYVAADGSLVSTADMEPCPDEQANCPTYPAAGPYRMALEVPKGRLAEVGVVEGSRLELGGDCPAEA
jgi:uncharacterized membrane protein (UPF0127 family)/predicted small secreted protein